MSATRSRAGRSLAVLGLACIATLAACGGRAGSVAATPAPEGSKGPPTGGVEKARADSARLPWTAADAQFMTHMIHHHSQAIVMARMAPTHGASPSVQTLASRIINAQLDEIATMQTWLRDRLQPVPQPDTMPRMAGMQHDMSGMHHDMGGMQHGDTSATSAMMPGMLTPAQLAQLDSARGPEFDRLFLTFMIQHHSGATQMVKDLFGTYGAAQDETVFKFASDVNVDQTTEIARMRRMLVALQLGAGSQ